MAQEASCSVPELEAQWATTALYGTPELATAFTKGASISAANKRVLDFCRSTGLLRPDQKIGISFPDGTVLGDKDAVTMRFDATYMEAAAKK